MVPLHQITGRLGNQLFQFVYIYSKVKDEEIPDIYIQDPQYFEKNKEELKKLLGEGIGHLPYVALHVRRGDYVNNPFYVDLSKTDYYQKAMAEFPDRDFLVFSDDIKWCKSYFGMYNKNIRYSEGKNEIEDFNLMASCDGIIIANSSFSYWAALLSRGDKVVAPSYDLWYSDKSTTRTIIPKEWIQI